MKTIQTKDIKFSIYLILLIFIASLSSCLVVDPVNHVGDTDYSARAPFTFEIPVSAQKHIEIKGINGPISITGRSGITTVKIWGERIVESDSYEDAEQHLESLEVLVSDNHDKISVITDQPSTTHGRNYQVIYNVIIPDNWNVEVENVNGSVEIDSLNANICIGLVNGDIVMTEIVGNIAIGVTNGTVCGKVVLPINGLCVITTVNGQVQLSIPTTTSAELSAKVANGTVSVSNLTLSNMISSRNSVTGTIGGGQGRITVEAVNGIISVNGF